MQKCTICSLSVDWTNRKCCRKEKFPFPPWGRNRSTHSVPTAHLVLGLKYSFWLEIIGSQKGWGWREPLKVIWSNPPAPAGPPRASGPGLCPDGLWVSPWTETPQPPWATCASAQLPSQQKWFPDVQRGPRVFLFVPICAHHLWSCHWALLRRAWLCPLCTLPSGIYIH